MKDFFVRRTPKVSVVGIILRVVNVFSPTSAIKFQYSEILKNAFFQ